VNWTTAAEPLICAFSIAFTQPTFQRVLVLIFGAIVSGRQHTVTAMLLAAGPRALGHWSDFHRVLSLRVWSNWPLGRVLAALVVDLLPADQPVVCLVDDTNPQHKGKRVYGKGRHHDAIRSTHSHTVWVWGHKWVVLAISVKFPFARRPWALPVLCALYRSKELNQAEKRRHKTPPDLAEQLMAVLIHWFPERKFILAGDGGYASHHLAGFCHRHRKHVSLVSRFHGDASLYEAPPRRQRKNGRPPAKGRKLPKPCQGVAKTRRRAFSVDWYGGQKRRVELVWGEGQWYRSGEGLVPIRWVFVHDIQGTHRDEYFYTTDPTLAPDRIVSLFTARWSIEVTFQEVRRHLGFATPRNWCQKSVLRTAPCLLGLFTLVTLIFARLWKRARTAPRSFPWYAKREITFSDAIAQVRRLCWGEVLKQGPKHGAVLKLPRRVRLTLLDQLCRVT
jgi:DDE superfamily endonuclease